MNHYSESEIESLIHRFEARRLPKSEWTHEAHLVVAIWYSKKYDFTTALDLVRENITKHNESVGTPNSDTEGYHESITRFWLLTAHKFINANSSLALSELCNDFIDSEFGRSDYPLTYYSPNLLFSVEARHAWVEPDIKAI
ncbi:MAG: hypothetical protein ED557_03625 [Balneola sp.]|nr:MAG: hypothetical protein ED557_03625 [Balneola sp.]